MAVLGFAFTVRACGAGLVLAHQARYAASPGARDACAADASLLALAGLVLGAAAR